MISLFFNIQRLSKIFIVLVRYNILPYTYFLAKRTIRKKPLGEKITKALQQLGPTFIKFGQSLSSRVDIIGEDIAKHLLLLCDRLPAFSYNEVQKIIEKDFKCQIEELFSEFPHEPIAAASIAQVHKAKTRDGIYKAVKVLRPNIKKIFLKDIKLLTWLAKICEKFKNLQRFQLTQLVSMFAEISKFELDLRFEAANAQELQNNTKDDLTFYVPKVDWHKTSQNVLTTEWVDGIPIYNLDKIVDREDIAKKLIFCFCNQVYRDRFFHADMHPGNLMVNQKNNIVAIDFGIMGRLDELTCTYIIEILSGFLKRDYEHVAKIHYQAEYVNIKYDNFITACRAIGEPIVGQNTQDISIAKLLAQLFKITADFNMQVQPQLLLLQKTMVLVEGLCRQLAPNVNMWEIAELWIKQHENKHTKCLNKIKNSHLLKIYRDFPLFIKKLDHSLDIIIKQNKNSASHKNQRTVNLLMLLIILLLTLKILISI